MSTIEKTQVELYQGRDEQNRRFGYVHGDDGGLFFTWMDNLDETIDSLEVDTVDGDGDLDQSDVAEFLRDYLPTTATGRKMWATDDDE